MYRSLIASPSAALATSRLIAVSGFIGLFVILLAAGIQPYVPIEYLMGDPAAISGQPLYFGVFSHIGVLCWTISAAVCLFSVALLSILGARSEPIQFLAAFGSLSAVLGLDDLFLLHERAFPAIFKIPQSFILLGYAVLLLLCLCRFRKTLSRNRPFVFGLSLFLFSVSVLIDVVSLPAISSASTTFLTNKHWLEDGSKLLGVFVWLTYLTGMAITLVMDAIDKVTTCPSAKP